MKKPTLLITLTIILLFTIQLSYSQSWKQLAAGTEFNMALRADSTIWTWGFNANGQLGQGDTDPRLLPTQMGMENDWIFIEAGAIHSFGIKSDGSLWAWGLNGNGQLGIGCGDDVFTDGKLLYPEDFRNPTGPIFFETPQQVGEDNNWVKVSAGFIHTLGLKADSTLWAWGDNASGELGDSTTNNSCLPIQIGKDTKWVDMDCGGIHSIALDDDGNVWTWGNNLGGQLGIGTAEVSKPYPVKIQTIDSLVQVSAGLEFSMARRIDGTIWSWGYNSSGQLGQGLNDFDQRNTPDQIGEEKDWIDIKTGNMYAFGLKEGNFLYAWGLNMFGNLGIGSNVDVQWPAPVHGSGRWREICPAEGLIYNIYVFGFHTIGLSEDYDYICATGTNYVGQLGDSTTTDRNQFICDIADFASGNGTAPNFKEAEIYPNPADSRLYILSNSHKIKNIEILDYQSKIIEFYQFYNEGPEYMITCENLNPGFYFIKLHFSDGSILMKKFVKN